MGMFGFVHVVWSMRTPGVAKVRPLGVVPYFSCTLLFFWKTSWLAWRHLRGRWRWRCWGFSSFRRHFLWAPNHCKKPYSFRWSHIFTNINIIFRKYKRSMTEKRITIFASSANSTSVSSDKSNFVCYFRCRIPNYSGTCLQHRPPAEIYILFRCQGVRKFPCDRTSVV